MLKHQDNKNSDKQTKRGTFPVNYRAHGLFCFDSGENFTKLN